MLIFGLCEPRASLRSITTKQQRVLTAFARMAKAKARFLLDCAVKWLFYYFLLPLNSGICAEMDLKTDC